MKSIFSIFRKQSAPQTADNNILQSAPQTAADFSLRGSLKHSIGDYVGAIKDFTKAIELDPENDTYYLCRGHSIDNFGDHVGAIKDFTKAIEIHSRIDRDELDDLTGSLFFKFRGACKCKIGDYVGAIEDYSEALERDSGNDFLLYLLGIARIENNDFAGGMRDVSFAAAAGDIQAQIYLRDKGYPSTEFCYQKFFISFYKKPK
jgi:tetratricopeptide (TPR) repeat protein